MNKKYAVHISLLIVLIVVILFGVTYAFFNCTNLTTVYVSDLWTNDNLLDDDSINVFGYNNYSFIKKIVGGAGTTFSSSHKVKEYARIDDPTNGKPGYFTYKPHM